jgi:hypothetical protein
MSVAREEILTAEECERSECVLSDRDDQRVRRASAVTGGGVGVKPLIASKYDMNAAENE